MSSTTTPLMQTEPSSDSKPLDYMLEMAREIASSQCPFSPAAIESVSGATSKQTEVDLRVEHRFAFQLTWDGPWNGTAAGIPVEKDNSAQEKNALNAVTEEVGRTWVTLALSSATSLPACGFAETGIRPYKLREVVSNETCGHCSGSGTETQWFSETVDGRTESRMEITTCSGCAGAGHHHYVGSICLVSCASPQVCLAFGRDDRFDRLLSSSTWQWWSDASQHLTWTSRELPDSKLAFQSRLDITFDTAIVHFADGQGTGLVGAFDDCHVGDVTFKTIVAASDEKEAQKQLPSLLDYVAVLSPRANTACGCFNRRLDQAEWFLNGVLVEDSPFDAVIDLDRWRRELRLRLIARSTTSYFLVTSAVVFLLLAGSRALLGAGFATTLVDLFVANSSATLSAVAVLAVGSVLTHVLAKDSHQASVNRWNRPSMIIGPLAVFSPLVVAYWLLTEANPLAALAQIAVQLYRFIQ